LQRSALQGERSHIGWTAREVVLPKLKPDGWLQHEELRPFVRDDGTSKASGAIIKVAGITGRIRGMKYKPADSRTVRPTLVVLDGRGSRVERVGFAWEKKGLDAERTHASRGVPYNWPITWRLAMSTTTILAIDLVKYESVSCSPC
jgi:hypothetical protein